MNTKKIEIRLAVPEDGKYLKKWLFEPGVLRWFPMCNEREVDDAVKLWMDYVKDQAVLTALCDGKPCGICNLYLQPYEKFKHQCLMAIVVGEAYRNKGIGRLLIEELMKIAKEKHHIEILHLEVYEGNPAYYLYEKMGFKKFGFQKHFIKEKNSYLGKTFMQKAL
jgi:putative acetyltransferase